MESLHRCPLCGSKNVVVETNYITHAQYYVIRCKDCKTKLARKTREQAIKDWNQKCKEYENE